ncbi:MAG: chemotaxis protein CheA [Phycisphaerales bacterium]
MNAGFDKEILQDFLTESGELIQSLEGDLVVLEGAPRDPELLNQVFRALHTIKGSASFLDLKNLVRVAHAAESALNAARNSVVVVDQAMMNLLLEAVDLIKTHLGQVEAGAELTAPRDALVSTLVAIGEGKAKAPATPAPAATPATPAPASPATRRLELGSGKADLLPFLVQDLDDTLAKLQESIAGLAAGAPVGEAARTLADQCEQLGRAADFFEFQQMSDLIAELQKTANALPGAHQHLAGVVPAIHEITALIARQAEGIKAGEVREVAADDALHRLEDALQGHAATEPAPHPETPKAPAKEAAKDAPRDEGEAATKSKGASENTIRVEVTRLEALMNLVGELVLQKNRVSALTRRVGSGESTYELSESLALAAESLDRTTGDIQVAVMRTRMQPLDKLFGRYPRLIRDLAAKTGKKINLVIEGGETEVDKSVIEELGDPLVHLLRNSCDHGLEGPDERRAAGKDETGTITLRASHEGSHVSVLIIDDGRGLSRERIGKKALERAMVTPDQLAQLTDRDVFRFIFEAGFSTADKVSDLSGRGVGMDVVRTNIQKLKGNVDLASETGKGTTITVTIPLTVAILQAMLVGVGPEVYAIPLTSILEIVRPTDEEVSTIGGHPVMRLRDSVLPLIPAQQAFDLPEDRRTDSPFAVVLHQNEHRVGLMVSRVIGQQEIVIKPLDDMGEHRRPAISGATVCDDGSVSLIVDVAAVINLSRHMAVHH